MEKRSGTKLNRTLRRWDHAHSHGRVPVQDDRISNSDGRRKYLASRTVTRCDPSAAQAEHRSADEVVADAVRVYLEKQSWTQFVERNARRAKEMGITEDDVDRLITEYRAENRQRGR
jgi:hypothetical protein